MNNYKG